jgi:ribosomal protein L40E
MRNIYKGLTKRTGEKTVCDKCGAEWEMRTRNVGDKCSAVHGFEAPFTICSGKLKKLN